jgi:heptosyltransferase-1
MRIKRQDFIRKRDYYLAMICDLIGYPLTRIFSATNLSVINNNPSKILLIGSHHIGDLLFITPALAALRKKYFKSQICVVASSNSLAILRSNPNVDEFILFDDSNWPEQPRISKVVKTVKVAARIRERRFDIGISYNSHGYRFRHFVLWLSRTKRRVGYAHEGFGFLLNDIVPFTGMRPVLEERFDFALHLGANGSHDLPELYLTADDLNWADREMDRMGFSDGPIIGISPGADHNFLWDDSKWTLICQKLQYEYRAEIVFLGDEKAIKIVERIRSQIMRKTYSLAGRTSVLQAAAFLRNINLLVCVDTGTRHMAAAVRTPVIFLRHGLDPAEELGPYWKNEFMVSQKVACAPCGNAHCKVGTYECVKGISVESVYEKITENEFVWLSKVISV